MSVDWYTEMEVRSISQTELAEAAGVRPQTVNRILRGHRHGRPSTLRAMAKALQEYPPVFGSEARDQ